MQSVERFWKSLAALSELYEKELSQTVIELYEKTLSKYTNEQIDAAMAIAAQTLKFMPKPAELIEIIEGKKGDTAIVAWESLFETMHRQGPYKSVLFEDGRICRAVNMMGGWINVCSWREDEMQYRRNEFIKIYSALPESEPEPLFGLIAADNTARGYLEYVPDPVVIERKIPQIEGQKERKKIEGK